MTARKSTDHYGLASGLALLLVGLVLRALYREIAIGVLTLARCSRSIFIESESVDRVISSGVCECAAAQATIVLSCERPRLDKEVVDEKR